MNYINENFEIVRPGIDDDDDPFEDFSQTLMSDGRILENYKEWKWADTYKYQVHVKTTSDLNLSDIREYEEIYMEDLEKRQEVYGECNECGEPGTGEFWCQPCNSKRCRENFVNWTSCNKDIDKFIQDSQLEAVHHKKFLEWIPFEKFESVTFITQGGFGKIESAEWVEGYIECWDIENQCWERNSDNKVALKCLSDSDNMNTDFLNEIKSHLQIYNNHIIQCYGITQNPSTKDYMMVLDWCNSGDMQDYLRNHDISWMDKLNNLKEIVVGLKSIHSAGKIHKDLHSGNILFKNYMAFISDLGMCQPANNEEKSVKKEGVYGVLSYIAPEVLCGYQYTKAADIYSFGIIMNEFLSEVTPYNDISHDHILAIKICKGLRPKISKKTPKLLTDLIMKCWDAKAEIRPTAKELSQILNKWVHESVDFNSEIYSQLIECENIRVNESFNANESYTNTQTQPQVIFISFKNIQLNQDIESSSSTTNTISECLDVQFTEFDIKELNQGSEESSNEHTTAKT